MAKIRASTGQSISGADSGAIEALRREIMQLRDTTTQYDMTVERSLQEIKQRLDFVESQQNAMKNGMPCVTSQKFSARQDEPQPVTLGQNLS